MDTGLHADANLGEVPDSVHRLRESRLCSPPGPKIGLSVRLREDSRGTDEVPGGKRKACVSVVLLRSDILSQRSESDYKKRIGGLFT